MGSIHSVEYYAAMKRSEALTQASAWMGLEQTTLSETSRRTMCDSICRKHPEQANPQRDEVGLWCQGAGGRGMTYWGGVSL